MADAPQVAFDNGSAEVYRDNHRLEIYPQAPETHAYYKDPEREHYVQEHDTAQTTARKPKTILGVRPKYFWILVGIAIIIVGATIGGSVGGSMAVRNSG
jgi:hypothetical protein